MIAPALAPTVTLFFTAAPVWVEVLVEVLVPVVLCAVVFMVIVAVELLPFDDVPEGAGVPDGDVDVPEAEDVSLGRPETLIVAHLAVVSGLSWLYEMNERAPDDVSCTSESVEAA